MIRTVAGFRFAAATAGLKPSGRPDFGLLLADEDVPVAACFTRSRVKGAPVLVSQDRAKLGLARAVVVHAGNANACTGRGGIEDTQKITRAVARLVDADERRVLAAATGVIGVRLPTERLLGRVAELVEGAREDGFGAFAQAILTTDRAAKIAYSEVALGKARTRLLGCAKGAGMVAPNLATTLGFLVTDAAVDGRWMRGVLREEVESTFNEVSVDGETSPNDSLFLLASGRAHNRRIDGGAHGRAFRAALRDVLDDLATQVVRDGLGATRTVTIEVAGAPDVKSARALARRVGASPLVKTAFYGADPNWGRILVALGSAGVDLDPDRVDIQLDGVVLVRGGMAAGGDAEARAAAVMRKDAYSVKIHLHAGHAEGRHVTCDLTHDYVKINSDYRS